MFRILPPALPQPYERALDMPPQYTNRHFSEAINQDFESQEQEHHWGLMVRHDETAV